MGCDCVLYLLCGSVQWTVYAFFLRAVHFCIVLCVIVCTSTVVAEL